MTASDGVLMVLAARIEAHGSRHRLPLAGAVENVTRASLRLRP